MFDSARDAIVLLWFGTILVGITCICIAFGWWFGPGVGWMMAGVCIMGCSAAIGLEYRREYGKPDGTSQRD